MVAAEAAEAAEAEAGVAAEAGVDTAAEAAVRAAVEEVPAVAVRAVVEEAPAVADRVVAATVRAAAAPAAAATAADCRLERKGIRRMRLIPIACFVSIVAIGTPVVACGSSGSKDQPSTTPEAGPEASSSSGDDAGPGGPGDGAVEATGYPAMVPTDVPQVVSRDGGVMPLPKVVPIFYPADDPTMTASIQDFVGKLGATDYWNGATAEYGIGQVVGETAINLTSADTPPTTYDDSDIETWLANKLQAIAPDPGFGSPDANTIYTFFFPAGVTVTMGGTSSGFPDAGAPEGGAGDGAPPSRTPAPALRRRRAASISADTTRPSSSTRRTAARSSPTPSSRDARTSTDSRASTQ